MSASERLAEQSTEIFAALFDSGANGVILPISDYLASLHRQERKIVCDTSRKRQLEFSTGRYCAKTALADFGIEDFPILRNEHREPLWPNGFVGSISHCRDICGAVIAKNSDFRSIGFDIENIKPLRQDITRHICTNQELTWLAQTTAYPYDTLVILLFSLKESVFKCVFPQHKIQLGFKDVTITPDFDLATAAIHFHHAQITPDIRLALHVTATHIFTSACSL